MCGQTRSSGSSLMPSTAGQQTTDAHLGIFVHLLKTQCDKEGAKKRERLFTPLPE